MRLFSHIFCFCCPLCVWVCVSAFHFACDALSVLLGSCTTCTAWALIGAGTCLHMLHCRVGFGFRTMPRCVLTGYCSDGSVLLPVLQSVILHCSSLGCRGQDYCYAFCLDGSLVPSGCSGAAPIQLLEPSCHVSSHCLLMCLAHSTANIGIYQKINRPMMARPRNRVPIWFSL